MRKIILLTLFLMVGSMCCATVLDSLLLELDRAIDNKQEYASRREDEIDKLKKQYRNAATVNEKLSVANEITLKYIVYRPDSALQYAIMSSNYAANIGDRRKFAAASINHARVLRVLGLYNEASEILDSIESQLPQIKVADYIDTRLSIFRGLL